MRYSVMPEQLHIFANLATYDRKVARRTQIELLTWRSRDQFPDAKLIEVLLTLAVMDIPDQSQADAIAKEFNCRVTEDKLEQIIC